MENRGHAAENALDEGERWVSKNSRSRKKGHKSESRKGQAPKSFFTSNARLEVAVDAHIGEQKPAYTSKRQEGDNPRGHKLMHSWTIINESSALP